MKSFDAFARPVQEFQVKTTFGGYLSVFSLVSVTILFVSQLYYFLKPETKDEMLIDQNQDQKFFNISIDMTLPQVPCAVLSMNLFDPKKANVMHVSTDIYKTRLSKSGKIIGTKVRDSLINVAQTAEELKKAGRTSSGVKTTHATTHLRCHSCFQSHSDEDDCCQTCEDIRTEFRKRGLNEKPADYVFGQCVEDAYEQARPEEGEGCHLQADLHVKKVPATLHIGVAQHFKTEFVKTQDLTSMLTSLDFSHSIDRLSFGPDFPGLVHVLNGRKKSTHQDESTEHYHYDIHVIPTKYIEDGADEIAGHQYSVTEYMKVVSAKEADHQDFIPSGLYLNYEFTPFEVKVTSSYKSLWHFLTECCAIIGGIFAFTGMLDNFAYQLNESMSTRQQANVM